MEVGESTSLTAIANKSLDMSRSLTEKIAAADANNSDDEDDAVVTGASRSSSSIRQVRFGSARNASGSFSYDLSSDDSTIKYCPQLTLT